MRKRSAPSWRNDPASSDDPLINSVEAQRLAGGISKMTLWRWMRDGVIPQPIKIRKRNYWYRSEYLRALESASRAAEVLS